jgi:hypothetical protein
MTPARYVAEAEITDTGCRDKNGRIIHLGDRVLYRIAGKHTKEEYWNPEYEVVWDAPCFTLKHVGGGKDGGNHAFILKHGGGNGYLEVITAALSARPAQGAVTEAMVEAGARAIWETWAHRAIADQVTWERLGDGWKRQVTEEARAAITAALSARQGEGDR